MKALKNSMYFSHHDYLLPTFCTYLPSKFLAYNNKGIT